MSNTTTMTIINMLICNEWRMKCEKIIIATLEMLYFRGVGYWKTKIVIFLEPINVLGHCLRVFICFVPFLLHPISLCFVIVAINTKHVSNLVIITRCGKRSHQMCTWSLCTRNVESSNNAPLVVATPNYVKLINMDLLVPHAFLNKRYISMIRFRFFFLLSNNRIETFTFKKVIICKSVK